ncbi:MAG: DUF4937 domain-containing protein [Proteobacteria bacterium]|nr:DUF4937 domain-containing protein [Pseudomonadota bacterium]
MSNSDMIIKFMRIQLKPGHRKQFLAAQDVWDRESRLTTGYLGEARSDGHDDEVFIHAVWATRAVYDTWMTTEHDRIEQIAGSEAYFEHIDIRVIDVGDADPGRTRSSSER